MPQRIFPLLASMWLVAGAAATASAAAERRFTLTPDGLGPIRLDEPADIAALKAAYPEFVFHTETIEREGRPETLIVAEEEGAPALRMRLLEGRYFDLLATSPRVVGPFGGRVGARFADLPVSTCLRGAEGSPFVHCASARTRRLQFLFVIDGAEPAPEDPIAALRAY